MRKRHNAELEQPSRDRDFHDPLGLFQSASSQNLSKCMGNKLLDWCLNSSVTPVVDPITGSMSLVVHVTLLPCHLSGFPFSGGLDQGSLAVISKGFLERAHCASQ